MNAEMPYMLRATTLIGSLATFVCFPNNVKNLLQYLALSKKHFFALQDTVTSAVFVPNSDLIVSGSDDRF